MVLLHEIFVMVDKELLIMHTQYHIIATDDQDLGECYHCDIAWHGTASDGIPEPGS